MYLGLREFIVTEQKTELGGVATGRAKDTVPTANPGKHGVHGSTLY